MTRMESKMAAAVATPTTVAPPASAPEPGFTCQCGRRFRQKAPYARHMDVAHSSCASIKCSVCGKTFGTHNTLTMHMSVHDVKQQPFVRLQHVADIKKAVTEVVSGGVAVVSSCDGVNVNNMAVVAAAPTVNGTAPAVEEKRAIIGDVRGDNSPDGGDAVRKSSRLRGKVPAWKAMLEDSSQSLDAADTDDGPASRKRKANRKSDDDEEEDDNDKLNWGARETATTVAPRDPGVAVVAPTPRAPPPLTSSSTSSSAAKRSRTGKRTTEPAAFVCPTCAKEFTSDKYLTMHRALHEVVNPAENLMSDVYRQPDSAESSQSSPRVRSPGGATGTGAGGGGAAGGGGGGANTSWTCKICRKTFAQNSNFKNHMRTHSDERPFVCSICSIGFKERYHLKKHQLFKHSTELREECRVCGKRFKDSTAVRAHERIHSDVRPYVCRRCGKAFKTSECLWHHENRSKTCGVALDEHVQRIRQQLQEQQQQQQQKQQQQQQQKPQLAVYGSCVKTEAYVKADPPRDLSDKAAAPVQRPRLPMLVAVPATMSPQAPPSGKPAAYLIVKKEPATSELQQACAFLQTVTTTEHEPDTKPMAPAPTRQSRFSCERCVKQFSTATAYERHLLKHSETRPYRCDACDVGFKLKVHLKKHHLYRHTDEYPCGCSICGKRFKDSSAVRLHERIHSTERPFRCGCGKTFKTRENLWGHQHRIQCDALAAGSGSRADAAACACCMPGATASPTRASDDDGMAPPDGGQTSVATARGQPGHVMVSAHASACSSRVVAQAYCAEKRVTAHAMIGHNGEVTAHVTIAPNPGGGAGGGEVRLTNGYGDVTVTPAPPRVNGHLADAAADQSSLPSFSSFATPTTTSGNATSIAQQCPTIQSFLLRGPDYSERTKLPGIQQIFQNHRATTMTTTTLPPSQSPSPRPPPSYSSYARSLQPSRNVVVLPNAAPDDLYTSVHERLAKTSLPPLYDKLRCDAYSDCGVGGDLSDMNDPCLTDCIVGIGAGGGGRSGIPVIYWDDEAERKSLLASPWHKDTDSLFHDISDGTFSHL